MMMQRKRKSLYVGILLIQLLFVWLTGINAQETKEIAVTMDDLPLNGPSIEIGRLQTMTGKLLTGFNKYQIPAVGFVNESLLYAPGETEARIAILKSWTDKGLELGNHTFSHLGFKNASLAEYEDDFIRGETVTKILIKRPKMRYFRHPYLQMGPTRELEQAFENFIAERGYRIAPVTVDTMDWMFLAAYAKAQKDGSREMLKQVSDEYLKFAALKFDFAEQTSKSLFGRQIKHILLLHANELNSDNFDALIKVIRDRGYRFITLEEALKDPVYQYPDKYTATSDWLSLWAVSRDKKIESPVPPDFIQKIYNGK